MKIPRTFKFSETTIRFLGKLAEFPEYGNCTRVIECLVWQAAQKNKLIQSGNGHADPRKAKVAR